MCVCVLLITPLIPLILGRHRNENSDDEGLVRKCAVRESISEVVANVGCGNEGYEITLPQGFKQLLKRVANEFRCEQGVRNSSGFAITANLTTINIRRVILVSKFHHLSKQPECRVPPM